MLTSLYADYFQKSKVFLFPSLGIARESFTQPTETFIAWKDCYTPEDHKLICLYNNTTSTEFKAFENRMLLSNPRFFKVHPVSPTINVYVFDMDFLGSSFEHFIKGKFSKLDTKVKVAITRYYGVKSKQFEYIKSYLYPEEYFKDYARLLDVPLELIESVGELCNIPDTEKETLKIVQNNLAASTKYL